MDARKIDAALAQALQRAQPEDLLSALATPAGDVDALRRELETRRMRFNYLPLAACFVIGATKDVLMALSDSDAVAMLSVNPDVSIE